MRVTAGSSHVGHRKAQQVGHQARRGRDDQRIAQQLAARTRFCAWRAIGQTAATLNSGTHTPISTAISSRPCGAGQPLGQGQPDEGVEAKGHLGAGRVLARVDVLAPGQGRCGSE